MKVVILAGGLGTRLSEETDLKPKPMVEIGGKPILWHIMKIYSSYGFNEFIVCLGYKGYVVKEYFANYFLHQTDVTLDLSNNNIQVHESASEPWIITLVDTGKDTMTGGRIKRVAKYLDNQPFMLTYGDGVSDVEIPTLLETHKRGNKLATLTAVQPDGRFGLINLEDNNLISAFQEKKDGDRAWVNGGFFVCEPQVLDLIKGDDTIWEREPLEVLAQTGQLQAYKHSGFWRPMDTLKDKQDLNSLWNSNQAKWKVW